MRSRSEAVFGRAAMKPSPSIFRFMLPEYRSHPAREFLAAAEQMVRGLGCCRMTLEVVELTVKPALPETAAFVGAAAS